MPAQYLHTIRQFDRDLHLFLFASGLVGFCLFGGIFSLLFNLYLLRLDYGPAFVGQVNAIGGLAFALSSLPGGFIGNRLGNRPTMIVGLCLAVIGHGLVSQAGFIPLHMQKAFVLTTHSLGLLGISLYIVNGYPFLMAAAKPADRNLVFSLQAGIFPLCGFAGSLLGGFLPSRLALFFELSPNHPEAYSHTLLLASALLIPAVIGLFATRDRLPAAHRETKAKRPPLPLGLISLLSVIAMLFIAAEGATRTFFNVYLDAALQTSTSTIGILSASGQLLAAPAALMMPYLVNRFGDTRTFNGAVICSAVALVPLALVAHWSIAGFCFMIVMTMAAIRRPAYTVFQQEMIPSHWRTTMAGAAATSTGLGYAAISLGGGYIIEASGYPMLFLGSALLSAVGSAIFLCSFRKHSNKALTAS